MTIDFSNLYWDEIINEDFIPLVENTDRYLILYGGRNSSKSDFTAKKLIFRCLTEKYFKYILVRSNLNGVKESSYETIKSIIEEWGLTDYFDFKVSPLEIVCKNGNRFISRGCDDPAKLKSIRNPTGVWWEEDIPSFNDFNTITLTIRSSDADYLQEIFTINPEVDGDYKQHWFYKYFFGDRVEQSFRSSKKAELPDGSVSEFFYTVHHSTYKSNKWAIPGTIAQLESLRDDNPHEYMTRVLGLWGNPVKDGLFYKKFDRVRNVQMIKYNPDLPLHISFDFNVRPYLSILICQIIDKNIYVIDEIAASHPHNNTRDAAKLFASKYSRHTSGLYIYGDPSGKNDSTRLEQGYNDYRLIEQELKEYRPTFRVGTKHPPVKLRGDFINDILSKGIQDLKLIIGENCPLLISDFMNVKEKPDGTKLKEKFDGVEKWAHLSDCFSGDTLIQTINGDKRIDEIVVGDLVLTRNGYKKVLKTWDKGIKEVNTYKIGDSVITCTKDHKFYTKEFGFKEVNNLIGTNTFIIYSNKTNQICEKQLNIETLNFIDIQKEKEDQKEFIIQEELREDELDYTSINMNVKLVKYQRDIISTIKTAIHSIMKSITSNVLKVKNIFMNICVNQNEYRCQKIYSKNMLDQKQLNGINQQKEENGIENMQNTQSLVKNVKSFVKSVGRKQQPKSNLIKNIVVEDAKVDLMRGYGDKDIKVCRVYDIMVEDDHEFFANNVLVHNCLDYLICEAFKSEFNFYKNGSNPAQPLWIDHIPSPKFRL